MKSRWNWVCHLLDELSKNNRTATEVRDNIHVLYYFLKFEDEFFWSLKRLPFRTILDMIDYNDKPYIRENKWFINEPIIRFDSRLLRDVLIGPGKTAQKIFEQIHISPPAGVELFSKEHWKQLDNHTKGNISEILWRLICTCCKILTLPVKYNDNNGLDSLSIIPFHGRLLFLSMDSKSKSEGWTFKDEFTSSAVSERIGHYVSRSSTIDEDNRLSPVFEIILKFSQLCLSSKNNIRSIPVYWTMIGGYTWPKIGGQGGITIRAIDRSSEGIQKARDRISANSDTSIYFDYQKTLNAIRFLLHYITYVESHPPYNGEKITSFFSRQSDIESTSTHETLTHLRAYRGNIDSFIINQIHILAMKNQEEQDQHL